MGVPMEEDVARGPHGRYINWVPGEETDRGHVGMLSPQAHVDRQLIIAYVDRWAMLKYDTSN